MSKFYVTTPIYYVNDVPHIGHAYSTMAADTLSRFYNSRGFDVFFLTGTDEHGQKVAKAAEERGISPQEHVDQMVVPYKKLWQALTIDNDAFIRTTEARHKAAVQEIFKRLYDKGDIYASKYEGWYCIHEETFYPQAQLRQGNCPECGRPVKWVSEDSYHFKTSKYMDRLLKHIKENPDFIKPESRRNEVTSFIESGVQDISVSRTAFSWGVEVPFDKKHVVYVWFDALINYLSGIGYLQDKDKFEKFWPADVHIIGKDILKFHAVIWPAMLMALDLELPKMVFAHGFLTLGGQKISKSKGRVINPHDLIDKYGADAVRYFFLREFTFGLDGEYTEETMIKRINADLANDLGNLVHRTANMMKKYFDGKVPRVEISNSDQELDKDTIFRLEQYLANLDFRSYLDFTWGFIGGLNSHIEKSAPWNLKKEDKIKELAELMYFLADGIRRISQLIYPFMPETAQKIWEQLSMEGKIAEFPFEKYAQSNVLPPGSHFKVTEPLFPRIEA